MTTTNERLMFSLNIARDYTPDWGVAEGVREFLANTLDESGTIDSSDPDILIFKTTSAPSLSELTIIGKSTKRDDASKIGQFGEGAKVGANALARAGAYVRIDTPSGRITFEHLMPPGFDTLILHAVLDRSICEPGCTTTISHKGISALLSTLYTDAKLGPMEKLGPAAPLRLFVKGIAVKAPGNLTSLYDWNTDLALNRDRAAVDPWSLKSHIASWFCKPANYSDTFLLACINQVDTIESQALQSYLSYHGAAIKAKIRGCLVAQFGDKCVLSSGNPSLDALAVSRGYTVVSIHSSLAAQLRQIDESLFATVDDKIRKHDTFCPVPLQTYSGPIAELVAIQDLLNIPATIQVFEPRTDDKIIGYCDSKTQTIWLCSTLFAPGARKRRLGTFLHELAHLPGHEDNTIEFECELTRLLGLLAPAALAHFLKE